MWRAHKILTIGIGLICVFGGRASAGALNIKILVHEPFVNTSALTIKHLSGASEGHDGFDVEFLDAPLATALDIYSASVFDPFKLGTDSRPPDSLSTIHAKIYGKNLSAPINAELRFFIWIPGGEDNFKNKSISAALYNPDRKLLGTYDIRDLAYSVETIPITVGNGHSYDIDVEFALRTNDRLGIFSWVIIIFFILLAGTAFWLLKRKKV